MNILKKILISKQSIFGCWDFCKILFQPFQICGKNVQEKKDVEFFRKVSFFTKALMS